MDPWLVSQVWSSKLALEEVDIICPVTSSRYVTLRYLPFAIILTALFGAEFPRIQITSIMRDFKPDQGDNN